MTFDEIMEYDKTNKQSYDIIVDQIDNIVPYIGAGISAFEYPTWAGLLEEFSKYIEYQDKKEEIKILIEHSKFEEAASQIAKFIGKEKFNSTIRYIYGRKITTTILEKEALYLIPFIFNGLILTTNYDTLIEQAFSLHKKHINKFTSENSEKFSSIIRHQYKNILYKFHGDLEEIDKIIFTKEQYDEKYSLDSVLVRNLELCIQMKPLLFLGCSLQQDRIMNLLSKNLTKDMENYAIISCNKGEKEKRSLELYKKGIRPIIYPYGEHTSVRIILDKLCMDTKFPHDGIYFYENKDLCLNEIINNTLHLKKIKNNIIFFGGISKRLCEQKDILELNQWLEQNKSAELFICYESEKVLFERLKQIHEKKISGNKKSLIENIRLIKEDKFAQLLLSKDFYSESVRNRVHFISIEQSLNCYLILTDMNLYYSFLSVYRSTESTIGKILDSPYGNKLKEELLDYMLFALSKSTLTNEKIILDRLFQIVRDKLSEINRKKL